MKRWALVAILLLGLVVALARLGAPGRSAAPTPPGLEEAAIARSLVADPADRDLVGLYARDTDRLCIVREATAYRIGGSVDYGDGIACSGAGRVERDDGVLQVTLGADCAFSARFEGDSIRFPARLPAACRRLCTRRASFAALHVDRLSASASEAAAMRTSTGKLPCGG